MNKKPANKKVVPKSIGLDPDVLRLFMKLPEGERSRVVNDILRRNLHVVLVRMGGDKVKKNDKN